MKKNGFTLVELIATLIILSLVSLIVVPNITSNLKKMKSGISDIQKAAIIDAAKYWASDNIDLLPSTNDSVKYVFLSDLKNYIDDKIYKNSNEEQFSDNIFVAIKCEKIESDNLNYKYSYKLYETNEKLLTLLAENYTKVNEVLETKTLTIPELIPYLPNDLTNLKVENKLKSIEKVELIDNEKVMINNNNGIYTYEVIK